MHIPAMVELTKNDPLLPLHKWFLDFKLIFMSITDYQLMQPLNVAKLILKQFKWLAQKLPNYAMVIYDSLKEQIQQIDKIYPYSVPTWSIISTTVLGTLIIIIGITIVLYCKYICISNQSRTSAMFWHKKNQGETETMFPSSSQQSITSSKVKATPEKVREKLELLGMAFCDVVKCKVHRNTKAGSKVTTAYV